MSSCWYALKGIMGPEPSPASPLLPGCELSSFAVTYALPGLSHSNRGNGPQASHSKTGARTKLSAL